MSANSERWPHGASGRRMRLSVLGATGSVGRSTLDIVARNPDRFDVVSLVANSDVAGLAELARKVGADCAVLARSDKSAALADALAGSGIDCAAGEDAVLEAVDRPVDMVVAAIVGAAGLRPTLRAMKSSRAVALANKECLVSAGDLFMSEARRSETTVLPVDSEHSAIFQVFEQENADQVEKVILTASGGPFRMASKAAMVGVTPEQALRHPNWDMGSRITIDSATMMNKGFEVIEAFHLFPLAQDQLDVLVHPQSVVHGLVQYRDGSLLAQLGSPDMRTPIAHCLAWPHRMDVPVERLDLARIGELSFEAPDLDRFPSLALSLQAMRRGGGATTILNAADEVAVAAFLNRRIGFMDIPSAVEASLERLDASHGGRALEGVEDVLAVDEEARDACKRWVASR
ncbi:1-deoxy-D-xylulose-5-phosphate reductoisomerase [Roseibium sp.]|uniref:1-deoxy-D-xylulose-5-phosphate reductoisomerase n=2 Tax=Pseudomonadota TaxID=1224 RepID=UPI003296725E